MMKTLLEETLEGEISETYRVDLYSKVNSCEMFSYAASSGFGSARGKGCSSGFGSSIFDRGNAPNSLTENSGGFGFRYRAGQHERYGLDHLNLDIMNPINPNKTLQK